MWTASCPELTLVNPPERKLAKRTSVHYKNGQKIWISGSVVGLRWFKRLNQKIKGKSNLLKKKTKRICNGCTTETIDYSAWVTKGQLDSEWIYEIIVSPKIPTKNYRYFCPWSLLEGSAEIFMIFGWYFGRNDDLMNSFWIQLTFKFLSPCPTVLDFWSIKLKKLSLKLIFADYTGSKNPNEID